MSIYIYIYIYIHKVFSKLISFCFFVSHFVQCAFVCLCVFSFSGAVSSFCECGFLKKEGFSHAP